MSPLIESQRTKAGVVGPMRRDALAHLSQIESAPGIPSTGYDNLADFAAHITDTSKFPGSPEVVVVSGKPGVGKTYTTNYIRNYFGLGRQADKVTWEGAENSAIEKKAVTVKKTHRIDKKNEPQPVDGEVVYYGEPWSDKALKTAESQLESDLFHGVINALHYLVAEIPARAVRTKDGKFVGRSLGSRALEKLLYRSGRFKNHFYRVHCVGLIAGVSLEEFSERYREEKKAADTFVKGIRIQSLYGQPLPQTPEEWKRLKSDGATLKQMRKIEDADKKAIQALEKDGSVTTIPDQEFEALYESYVKPEAEKYGFDEQTSRSRFRRSLKDAQRIWDVYSNWFHLKGHSFVGYNNPTILQMVGGDYKKAEALSARWKTGTKMIPLKKDTWHTLS